MSDETVETTVEVGLNSDPVEKESVEEITSTPEGNVAEVSAPKMFTQDEVNKMLGDVRQDARSKGERKALEEFFSIAGVQSGDELQGIIEEYKDIKLSAMTEQERLAAELEEARSKAAQAEALAGETKAEADKNLIKSAIVGAAAGRFADAEAAYKLVDLDNITLNDGQVLGVEEALNVLEEKYPFLKKGKTSVVSPTNPEGAKESKARSDAARRAEYFGMSKTGFWEGEGVRRIVEEQ